MLEAMRTATLLCVAAAAMMSCVGFFDEDGDTGADGDVDGDADADGDGDGDTDVDADGDGDLCAPDCTGRECGPDGCGSTCGTCAPPSTCTDDGRCATEPCAPNSGFGAECTVPCADGSDCVALSSLEAFGQICSTPCSEEDPGCPTISTAGQPSCVIGGGEGYCAVRCEADMDCPCGLHCREVTGLGASLCYP